MPVWGWVLLIAVLGGLLLAAVLAIVYRTRRARSREPLHGDPKNIAAPVPLDVARPDAAEREQAPRDDLGAVGG